MNRLRDVSDRLRGLHGAAYWRSLEELADTPAFRALVEREFPSGASAFDDEPSRRQFLKVLGAFLAMTAGASACSPGGDRNPAVLPYVRAPEDIIPGQPMFYATAMPLNGYGLGLLVESHMGRPTKVEGNPQHPASLGATDAFAQACVLQLYDPDRSAVPLRDGRIQPWPAFVAAAQAWRRTFENSQGRGVHVLTETITSPTLLAQMQALQARLPGAVWHRYDLALTDAAQAGARLVFGRSVEWFYRFDRADVVVALDADIFSGEAASVRYAHDFAERRRVRSGATSMNRLYAVEASPTPTGAVADHRLAVRATQIGALAQALAAELGLEGTAATATWPSDAGGSDPAAFVAAAAADLRQHAGRGLVVAGPYQPAAVHALAHAMNAALGNAGATVIYIDPIAPAAGETESLQALAAAMDRGEVDLLLMIGGNPAYSAPADLNFAAKLARVPASVHVSLFVDETSRLATWHIPQTHFLEAWGDVRAFDGTATIIQPLIEPLYGGHSAHEVLAAFSPEPLRSGYDIVRTHWRSRLQAVDGEAGFDRIWARALHEGVVPGTASPPIVPAVVRTGLADLPASSSSASFEVVFRPDPSVYDGRFANNAWLQELPKPITKLTWDNAVLLAPSTAAVLGITTGDVLELEYRGRRVTGPAFLLPGHARDSVTLHLGYGRSAGGSVAADTGFNANAIRTSDAPWIGAGLVLRRTGGRYALATTQEHHLMHGRDFVRAGTFDLFLEHPRFPHEREAESAPHASLYPEWSYEDGPQWGMVIDNTVCTGCSACVVACQAENNVPAVGKAGVLREREMHWLRIDHYFLGTADNPRSFFQPMLCQHCEKAPCEVVCPVAATTHSTDGLNQMIYNRCVGTRYCSNNCPYKVRRFNFFDYGRAESTPSLKLLMNPDVTVRTLGVMEKCTYCVQRINAARIDARREARDLADGDVVTACQSACPTQAIVFGNLNDARSRVAALRRQPHNYALLAELNTQPRTTYLAALRNLNDRLDDSLADPGEETS